MQLQGVKNLPKLNQFTEEAYDNLEKKQEEYRKYTRGTYNRFEWIVKTTESYCISFEKSLISLNEQDKADHLVYFSEFIGFFQAMLRNYKELSQKIRNVFKGIEDDCMEDWAEQAELMSELKQRVKNYELQQQHLIQNHKKFTKLSKSMITNIDIYKQAFTDVKLIYNRSEKLKRYRICENNYNDVMHEYKTISETVEQLTKEKAQMGQVYTKFLQTSRENIRIIGQKIKMMSISFVQNYCEMESQFMVFFNQSFESIAFKTIEFSLISSYLENEEKKYLEEDKDNVFHPYIPGVILNHQHIKETHYPHIGIFLVHLEKELLEVCKKRKQVGKQVLEMIINFQKAYEKNNSSFRDFYVKWEKRKKKAMEYYGVNSGIFIKSFSSVFEICLEGSDKISRFIAGKARSIDQLLGEESRILDALFKDYKAMLDKFFLKKQAKKSSIHLIDMKKQEMIKNEGQTIRKQTTEKLEHLKSLFQQSYQRLSKNNFELKINCDSILKALQKNSMETYANIKEQIELGMESEGQKNISDFVQEAIKSKTSYYEDSPFGSLLIDSMTKIVFDPDMNKVQDFQKLKKPVELLEKKEKEEEKRPDQVKQIEGIQEEEENVNQFESPTRSVNEAQTSYEMSSEKPENSSKKEAFLQTKIAFLPEQKYFKSFVCGLQDKIILTGRLYITNERLCFYSKFNPKNVFFGETFIEIPRRDIKKIEKRFKAVIFDNSISITTVNGELFFTSFIFRNNAYDTILSAMEITLDEFMYVEEQLQIEPKEELVIQQDDDLKQKSIPDREKQANNYFNYMQFDWKEILNTSFTAPGLNALKLFKIFETSTEITYNRAKYKGFNHFFKQHSGHINLDLEDWVPSVQEYLNPANLKEGTPLPLTRKFVANVPLGNTGIPFMPKFSQIVQTATIFLISKDKYLIHFTIKSSGVPYCDDFLIHYRKEIETADQDTVSYKVFFHIHFINQTMMKGVIFSKSFEDSKTGMAKLEEEMKKYLKYIYKHKISQSKAEKGENEDKTLENLQQINESLSGEIEDLKRQKQTLAASLSSERSKTTKLKLGLVVCFLLQFYLIFTILGSSAKEEAVSM